MVRTITRRNGNVRIVNGGSRRRKQPYSTSNAEEGTKRRRTTPKYKESDDEEEGEVGETSIGTKFSSTSGKITQQHHCFRDGAADEQKKETKAKKSDESTIEIGRTRIEIWWSEDECWYKGTIIDRKFASRRGRKPKKVEETAWATVAKPNITVAKYLVEYDDGEEEWIDLRKEVFNLLSDHEDGSNDDDNDDDDDDEDNHSHKKTEEEERNIRNKLSMIGIGTRVSVYWDVYREYYDGTVTKMRTTSEAAAHGRASNNPHGGCRSDNRRYVIKKPYYIVYDDGDKQWTNLRKRKYKILPSSASVIRQQEQQHLEERVPAGEGMIEQRNEKDSDDEASPQSLVFNKTNRVYGKSEEYSADFNNDSTDDDENDRDFLQKAKRRGQKQQKQQNGEDRRPTTRGEKQKYHKLKIAEVDAVDSMHCVKDDNRDENIGRFGGGGQFGVNQQRYNKKIRNCQQHLLEKNRTKRTAARKNDGERLNGRASDGADNDDYSSVGTIASSRSDEGKECLNERDQLKEALASSETPRQQVKIGTRVSVYWGIPYDKYYDGVVTKIRSKEKNADGESVVVDDDYKHEETERQGPRSIGSSECEYDYYIVYDDGDEQWTRLRCEKYKVLSRFAAHPGTVDPPRGVRRVLKQGKQKEVSGFDADRKLSKKKRNRYDGSCGKKIQAPAKVGDEENPANGKGTGAASADTSLHKELERDMYFVGKSDTSKANLKNKSVQDCEHGDDDKEGGQANCSKAIGIQRDINEKKKLRLKAIIPDDDDGYTYKEEGNDGSGKRRNIGATAKGIHDNSVEADEVMECDEELSCQEKGRGSASPPGDSEESRQSCNVYSSIQNQQVQDLREREQMANIHKHADSKSAVGSVSIDIKHTRGQYEFEGVQNNKLPYSGELSPSLVSRELSSTSNHSKRKLLNADQCSTNKDKISQMFKSGDFHEKSISSTLPDIETLSGSNLTIPISKDDISEGSRKVRKEKCPICKGQDMRQPTSLECSHLFCKDCIKAHCRKKRACPVCCHPLPGRIRLKNHVTNPEAFRSVEKIDKVSGEVLAVYPSASSASQDIMERACSGANGTPTSHAIQIIEACKALDGKKKYCCGFLWKYGSPL